MADHRVKRSVRQGPGRRHHRSLWRLGAVITTTAISEIKGRLHNYFVQDSLLSPHRRPSGERPDGQVPAHRPQLCLLRQSGLVA